MAEVSVFVDGREVRVAAGSVVAVAVAVAGHDVARRSISGEARGALCGMGICFECRVTIDGQPHRLGCQVICMDGMRVALR